MTHSPNPSGPPDVIAGRYRIGDLLGEGGAAQVYRATDLELGVERAIKLMAGAEREERAGLRRRLKEEARVMARLEHRNILDVYDVGRDGDYDFVLMQLATGGSLADGLKLRGPLPHQAVIRIGVQVLDALAVAHSHGIVHRDVKPQNLLLDGVGTVLLADFGIALIGGAEAFRATRTGAAMGSLAFMGPEQRVDASRVTAAADIYAVGATLYTLVCGRSPMDLFVLAGDDERWRAVPPALRAVLFRATRYAPEERFGTAADMAAALTALLREPGREHTGGITEATWQPELPSGPLSAPTGGWLDELGHGGSMDAPSLAAAGGSLAGDVSWAGDSGTVAPPGPAATARPVAKARAVGLPDRAVPGAPVPPLAPSPADARSLSRRRWVGAAALVIGGVAVLSLAWSLRGLLETADLGAPAGSRSGKLTVPMAPESAVDPGRTAAVGAAAQGVEVPAAGAPEQPASRRSPAQKAGSGKRQGAGATSPKPATAGPTEGRSAGGAPADSAGPEEAAPGLAKLPFGRWRLTVDGYVHDVYISGGGEQSLVGRIVFASRDGTNRIETRAGGRFNAKTGELFLRELGRSGSSAVELQVRLQDDGRFTGTISSGAGLRTAVLSHVRS